jgi:acyl carrier protein
MNSNDSTFAMVAAAVADVFQVPAASVTPATEAADVQGWDSLAHSRVIMSIERRCSVRLPARQAFLAANVGALSDLVTYARRA